MKNDSLKKVLQEKLSTNVSEDFDTTFWNEFEKIPKTQKEKSSLFSLSFLGSSMVAVCLLFIAFNFFSLSSKNMKAPNAFAATEAVQSIEILSNLDTELLDLSEEDLEILLKDEEES